MDQSKSPTAHVSNIEDYEKYLIHSRGEIIQKLKLLGKKNNLVTAHIGNDTVLTAVVSATSPKGVEVPCAFT